MKEISLKIKSVKTHRDEAKSAIAGWLVGGGYKGLWVAEKESWAERKEAFVCDEGEQRLIYGMKLNFLRQSERKIHRWVDFQLKILPFTKQKLSQLKRFSSDSRFLASVDRIISPSQHLAIYGWIGNSHEWSLKLTNSV